MTENLLHVLEPLTESGDPVRATIARAFIETPAAVFGEEGQRSAAPVRELLAMLAARGEGLWLSRIHSALIDIDERLLEAGVVERPTACRFAPMLAMLTSLMIEQRILEATSLSNARRSPIVETDKGNLLAAPVSPLGEVGMKVFVDRLLREVMQQRPKQVLVTLDGLDGEDRRLLELTDLEDEVKIAGGKLELI